SRVEHLDGKEYLYYPALSLDVAIIRATTADEHGYLSLEEEPNALATLQIAAATKACGGQVIAQVKRVARAGSLDPRLVRVPGALVDVLVVHPGQAQVSSTMADPRLGWNPGLAGALKVPLDDVPPLQGAVARTIARRALLALSA